MSAVLTQSGLPNSSGIAREAIRQLATRRLPPTPDNYARLYAEISGTEQVHPALTLLKNLATALQQVPAMAQPSRSILAALKQHAWSEVQSGIGQLVDVLRQPAPSWRALLGDLLRQSETRQEGLTTARKREVLERVIAGAGDDNAKLHQRMSALVKGWSQIRAASAEAQVDPLEPVKSEGGAGLLYRELLAQTIESAVVERLGYTPELAVQAKRLAQECRDAVAVKDVNQLATHIKQLWVKLELRGETIDEIMHGLLTLLKILIGNCGELAGEDQWMKTQMARAASLLAEPLDVRALREAERGFREVAARQGAIRHSLDEAKTALKTMVTMFIDRLGALTEATGGYQEKFERYATTIEDAEDIGQLSTVLSGLLTDTRGIQSDMKRTKEELGQARRAAEEREERVRTLEAQLEEVASLVKEDPLTSVLNRRGLYDAYAIEEARCERADAPLAAALLDVDNFKHLNDRLGHQAGDSALQYLATILRETVRPHDVVARYGGEEFVLLLPETTLDEATTVMTRVQREMTRRFFLHENEKVLITFSAGVALRHPGESRDELIGRADAAMYQAKTAGKNQVCTA